MNKEEAIFLIRYFIRCALNYKQGVIQYGDSKRSAYCLGLHVGYIRAAKHVAIQAKLVKRYWATYKEQYPF